MKTCIRCKESKELTDFYKHKERKDGLQSICKTCANLASANWRKNNPESSLAITKKSQEKHKDETKLRVKVWNQENKEKLVGYQKKYRSNNKEKVSISEALYRATHKEEINNRNALARKKSKDKKLSQGVESKKVKTKRVSSGKSAAQSAKRRATKLNAVPSWLTKEQWDEINAVYRRAQMIEERTGIPQEVDHEIPLQGENVCGLHVPWNLLVFSVTGNRVKGNNFDPVAYTEYYLPMLKEIK